MFTNMGLHVIQFPSKRWGYVGSIPRVLGEEVKANKAAIMGQRAYRNSEGELVETKFPSFDTEQEAIDYAEAILGTSCISQSAPSNPLGNS